MSLSAKERAVKAYLEKFDLLIVSGASSGIGRAFLELAHAMNPSMHFVNVSRKNAEDPGFASFTNIYGDFSSPESLDKAVAELSAYVAGLKRSGKAMLINNSGVGEYTEFCEADDSRIMELISVNDIAPLLLTKAMCPFLLERGGAVLNVCSTAAFQPTPFMAVYGASKAFLLNWSVSINAEMESKGCTVTALCPGPTDTNFFKSAGYDSGVLPDKISVPVANVALYGYWLLARRRVYGISGLQNKVLNGLSRMVPLGCSGKLAHRTMVACARRRAKKGSK